MREEEDREGPGRPVEGEEFERKRIIILEARFGERTRQEIDGIVDILMEEGSVVQRRKEEKSITQ